MEIIIRCGAGLDVRKAGVECGVRRIGEAGQLDQQTRLGTMTRKLMAMTEPRVFRSYDEFFAFYLEQHRDAGNRWMHAIGTTLGLIVAIVAFATHHPWYALLWIPLGYGFAWTGHFLLEKNTPATFGHPFWSFISDFRMLGLMITGRLGTRLGTSDSNRRS